MKVIKRYKNRKLYDTEASRYVNLTDVFNFVREGNGVQVVNASNEDITVSTLLAAVLEQGKSPEAPRLTVESLTSIITSGDGSLAGFVNNTLEGGV